MDIEIMLFCKKNTFCDYAIHIIKSYFNNENLLIVRGDSSSTLDEDLSWYKPRYIISFLSPWIIPSSMLQSAQVAAINFHPGSPYYPGSGCYNFAIYEKAKEYGVTCHYMNEKVDTGKIIMTSAFNLSPNETVESLKLKSMNHLLYIFQVMVQKIYFNEPLPESDEIWQRPPFTKKQLNHLCRIDPYTMNKEEIELRIRATDYCKDYEGAYIEIGDKRFSYVSLTENPIV